MPQAYDNYGRLKVIRGLPGAIEWFPGDGPALDDFGRQRVSDPECIFSSSFEYDIQTLLFESSTATGGTVAHNANKRVVTLTTTGTVGSSAVFQQRQYNRYQPGKSQRFKQTFVLGAAVAGQRVRIGYFDASNGLFLEQATDGTLKFVVRSSVSGSVVDTAYSQAAWTVDVFDGSGISGIDLDITFQQIMDVSFQWLGAGRVRFGFNINGLAWYANYANHANLTGDAPYMQTANLPLRYEVVNVSGAAGKSVDIICCEVESEGGVENQPAFHFTGGNRVTSRTCSGDRYPVMSIRPAATFNSIVNRVLIVLESIALRIGTNDALWEIIYGGALTGASWAAANATYSAAEIDVSATAVTGGIATESEYAIAGAGSARGSFSAAIRNLYPICLDISGANPKIVTLAITPVTGNSAVSAQFSWTETR